jgi:hypothetical protein
MPAPTNLHAAGGASPPGELRRDLRCLMQMPAEAVAAFWQALGPALRDPSSEKTANVLDVFCAAYRVSEDDLARAIKACRYLIEGGARLDLPPDDLAEDIDQLCPEAPEIKTLLLSGYEAIHAELRGEIVAGALADHGKLLVSAKWRLDFVDSSDRGARLRVPVVMLTLQYREGAELRRITLQALPDTVGQLKGICEQVLR